MRKLYSRFVYIWYAVYYCFAYIVGLLLRHFPKYKGLWLVCERKTDARDNGICFFEFLRTYHPEVNAAYIIDEKSADFDRAAKQGRVIKPGTFSHMLAFACAKVCISTHVMGYAPDTYRFAVLDGRFGLVRGKKVFLQHGIIMNDLPELHYPKSRLDLFVCTAIPEFEFIKNRFCHPEGVVRRLGLCRYDALLEPHVIKRQILIMPTWRIYHRGLSDEEFMHTKYYKNFCDIIENRKMQQMLEEYDFEIVLYLHYEFQCYTKLFESENKRVRVCGFDSADVGKLLMESAFLVTDYSSVYCDFAYMRKPLLYLWFDEERFFDEHYKRGYMDCRRGGFGPVFDNAEDAVCYIKERMSQGLVPEEIYKKRIDKFFYGVDGGNCRRTYDAVLEILER